MSLVLPGILVLLVLILSHSLAREYGVAHLFWREDSRWLQGTIGVFLAFLVWQDLLAGYLFEEFATNYTFDRPPFCENPNYLMPGYSRFRLEPASLWSFLIYSGGVAACLALCWGLIELIVVFVRHRLGPDRDGGAPASPGQSPSPGPQYRWLLGVGAVVGFLLLCVWADVAFRHARRGDAASSAMSDTTGHGVNGPASQGVGYVGELMVRFGGWGEAAGRQAVEQKARLVGIPDEKVAQDIRNEEIQTAQEWLRPYFPVYGLFATTSLMVFALSITLVYFVPPARRLFSPAIGILSVCQVVGGQKWGQKWCQFIFSLFV